MDINIEIIGIDRTPEQKNRVYIQANDAKLTFLLDDNEVNSLAELKNALRAKLKARQYLGEKFTVTI